MAHYNSEIRIDEMEVQMVGYNQETGTAYIDLVQTARLDDTGERAFIKQSISLPLTVFHDIASCLELAVAKAKAESPDELALYFKRELV